MTEDRKFTASVKEAPNDTGLRLAYADWLAKRDDSRADLIRVEEEMRRFPVFSDRYWELKARRNALRGRVSADWLNAMSYGTDCQPLFRHGLPDGCKERWRLIREYTERWHRAPLPDAGGRATEVRRAEIELGRKLPSSLREWVAFSHDLRRSPEDHEVLRDVYQMRELDGHSAVSLLLQAEGDYHWAVRHADLTTEDPPVHGFHLDYEDEDESTFVPDKAKPVAATVTSFVLDYVIAYTYGQGGGFATTIAKSAELGSKLKAALPVRCEIGTMEMFEADNIQVRLQRRQSREYIAVEVFKPMPREAVPAFLWDYTRDGGSFHGMFVRETET